MTNDSNLIKINNLFKEEPNNHEAYFTTALNSGKTYWINTQQIVYLEEVLYHNSNSTKYAMLDTWTRITLVNGQVLYAKLTNDEFISKYLY